MLRRAQDIAGQRQPAVIDPLPAASTSAAAAIAPTATRFRLTKILFPASHFLTPAELDAIAAPYVGREIGGGEIAAIVAAVDALYDKRGIITARAAVPPQDHAGGTLRVDLFEGRLGTLRAEGNAHVRDAYLLRQARLVPGDTIDPVQLRASLWRFNRLSDVQLRASLAPGSAPGLTDVTINAAEPRRDQLTAFLDNHAYQATGTYEGGLLFRHSGLLGLDDRLSALVVGSQGAVTGTASYDVPVGYDGTRLGLSYGHSITRVIAGAYAAFGSKGLADSINGELVQPLWSDRKWLLEATASSGYTRTRNYLRNLLISTNGTTKAAAGLLLSHQGRTRAFTAAASATWAHGEIENGLARGSYALINGNIALTQAIAGPVSVTANGAWQWSSARGLPSDLLFQIGGPTTVRGYTQGALAGDKGYYLESQLNLALPSARAIAANVFAFVDTGHVTATFSQPNALSSAGIGASLRIGRRIGLETNLGHALRNHDLGPGEVHGFARLTFDLF